jgi:hypothetical protein
MRWMSTDRQWLVVLVHLTATGSGRDGGLASGHAPRVLVGEVRDWDGVARMGVDSGVRGDAG